MVAANYGMTCPITAQNRVSYYHHTKVKTLEWKERVRMGSALSWLRTLGRP